MKTLLRAALAIASLAALDLGCSSPTASGAGSSSATTSGPPADFACVGHSATPDSRDVTSDRVLFVATDAITSLPQQGLTVSACDATDPECATPVATAPTDEYGFADLDVPGLSTFDGFYSTTSPGEPRGLFYFNAPLPELGVAPPIYTAASLDIVAHAVGATLDPARAFVRIAITNCAGVSAPGAVVAIDGAAAATTIAYSAGDAGTPYPNYDATDTSGLAFAFNVQPGTFTVRATVDGALVATRRAIAVAGGVTEVSLSPTN